MHGLKEDQPPKDNKNIEEVGAFAFITPGKDESEVSFALFDENNKENVEPFEMIVENLSEDANVTDDEPVDYNDPEVGSTVLTVNGDSNDSTYYDAAEDEDFDFFFDFEDVLVSPPSPMSVSTVIDLTKSFSSCSESSKVARIPTATASEDSYSDSDLFPSDSSDGDMVYVKTAKADMDSKPAAIVDLSESSSTPVDEWTYVQIIPELGMFDALLATDRDLQEGELLMDPEDRDRTIVAYRLDEIAVAAAYDANDAWPADSSDPVAIMEHIDPKLVRRIDLVIETQDQEDLDLLLGVTNAAPGRHDGGDDEIALMQGGSPLTLSALDDDTMFVLDTGCTVHTKKNMRGGFNIRTVKQQDVVAFDGRAM